MRVVPESRTSSKCSVTPSRRLSGSLAEPMGVTRDRFKQPFAGTPHVIGPDRLGHPLKRALACPCGVGGAHHEQLDESKMQQLPRD